jgi:hypothetical protein
MYFCVTITEDEKSIREYDLFGDFKKKITLNDESQIYKYGQFIVDQSQDKKDAYNYSIGIEISTSAEKIKISGDVGGRSPIYYFNPKKRIFIASNSLLVLKDCMKLLNYEVRPNFEIIRIQIVDSWIFDTAFSHYTLINNVFLCSKNNYLQYEYLHGFATEVAFKTPEDFNIYSYREAILKSAEHLRRVMAFHIDQYSTAVISLSGGQDSRILFSAALTLPENLKKKIKFKTGGEKSETRDFLVAKGLCTNYGVSHNEKISVPLIKISDEHTINRWKHENVGWCYYNNISNNFSANSEDLLSLRGGQIHPTHYPIVFKRYLKSEVFNSLGNDFEKSANIFLNGTNFSEFNDDFFNQHYGFFRYRIHYGRNNSLRTLWTSIEDPLINPWHEAANYLMPLHDRNLGGICRDMCLNLESSVLAFEFDKIENSIDDSFVRQSDFYPNNERNHFKVDLDLHRETYYDRINPEDLPRSKNSQFSEIIFDAIRNSFFVNKVIPHEKILIDFERYRVGQDANRILNSSDLKLFSLSLIFD